MQLVLIMQYCKLILLSFAECVLVCTLTLQDTWKDSRFLVMYHTARAQYVIWESRSITEGIIFLIIVDRFLE